MYSISECMWYTNKTLEQALKQNNCKTSLDGRMKKGDILNVPSLNFTRSIYRMYLRLLTVVEGQICHFWRGEELLLSFIFSEFFLQLRWQNPQNVLSIMPVIWYNKIEFIFSPFMQILSMSLITTAAASHTRVLTLHENNRISFFFYQILFSSLWICKFKSLFWSIMNILILVLRKMPCSGKFESSI